LSAAAISCVALNKSYPKHTVFSDLELVVPGHGICALLGKNGAGKTTLIRLALGLARPTAGRIELLSSPPGAANSRVGYLSENLAIYPHLSAVDNMRVAYDSAGVRPPSSRVIGEQLARVGLDGTGRRRSRGFSLGMKRRLQLAMATMVRPVDLLVLDEPTNGLDLDGVTWLRDYVAEQAAAGTSVVISTHALSELEPLVTHVTILHNGTVALNEPWTQDSGRSQRLRLSFEPQEFAQAVSLLKAAGTVTLDAPQLLVFVETETPAREILGRLNDAGIVPTSHDREQLGLKGAFRAVTAET
jgi:ABC-2 type transport system ATP-binding protein